MLLFPSQKQETRKGNMVVTMKKKTSFSTALLFLFTHHYLTSSTTSNVYSFPQHDASFITLKPTSRTTRTTSPCFLLLTRTRTKGNVPCKNVVTQQRFHTIPPSSISSTSQLLLTTNEIIDTVSVSTTTVAATTGTSTDVGVVVPAVEGLSPTANTIIFIIGLIPFIWATYEFWSRIAVGASFGTGADSIQIKPLSDGMKELTTIGKEGDLKKSRGQQVLGDDALIVAYFLFIVAIGSVGIAIYSVVTSPTQL